jgi:hypothetical protein
MTARVLVAYAASTGFTSRQAGAVASQIAEVSGLEVDVQPITYVPTVEPYVAIFLGWSGHSRAGRRETLRFLTRNAALLPDRRVWVVHHQPGSGTGAGPVRLSRLQLRHGVGPAGFDGTSTELDQTPLDDRLPVLVPAGSVSAAEPA